MIVRWIKRERWTLVSFAIFYGWIVFGRVSKIISFELVAIIGAAICLAIFLFCLVAQFSEKGQNLLEKFPNVLWLVPFYGVAVLLAFLIK